MEKPQCPRSDLALGKTALSSGRQSFTAKDLVEKVRAILDVPRSTDGTPAQSAAIDGWATSTITVSAA